MGYGTVQLTSDLLEKSLGIKEGIHVNGVEYDPFRGIMKLLLIGEDLPEKLEGAYPVEVYPEQVMEIVPIKKEEKSKVSMSFMITAEESGNLERVQWPEVPDGFTFTHEKIHQKDKTPGVYHILGGYRINISGKFNRDQVVQKTAEMNTWCHKIMELAKGE